MSRSIRFVICRSKNQSDYYFKFLSAISHFYTLFQKSSQSTNQSDLRNNAQHVIRMEIFLLTGTSCKRFPVLGHTDNHPINLCLETHGKVSIYVFAGVFFVGMCTVVIQSSKETYSGKMRTCFN